MFLQSIPDPKEGAFPTTYQFFTLTIEIYTYSSRCHARDCIQSSSSKHCQKSYGGILWIIDSHTGTPMIPPRIVEVIAFDFFI